MTKLQFISLSWSCLFYVLGCVLLNSFRRMSLQELVCLCWQAAILKKIAENLAICLSQCFCSPDFKPYMRKTEKAAFLPSPKERAKATKQGNPVLRQCEEPFFGPKGNCQFKITLTIEHSFTIPYENHCCTLQFRFLVVNWLLVPFHQPPQYLPARRRRVATGCSSRHSSARCSGS